MNRTGYSIKRPSSEWQVASVVPLEAHLPNPCQDWLQWLSDRWDTPTQQVLCDILLAQTHGRYLLDQITFNHLQAEQAAQQPMNQGRVCVLEPCYLRLESLARENDVPVQHLAGKLIQDHLQGRLHPHKVSLDMEISDGMNLRRDDDDLKVHLPELLISQIDELGDLHGFTRSDVIRDCLALHVYGRLRYEMWTSEGNWRPKRKVGADEAQAFMDGEIRFSRGRATLSDTTSQDEQLKSPHRTPSARAEFIRLHGKSQDATRVFMPAQLKKHLLQLADVSALPLSEYCRRTLITVI
ncbi:MAG: hypothetical protein RJA34_2470 [Pseudomonadota bacterium]|jgi:hypothetical protein